MIELLNRRRMVTLIILLITICAVIVIIEDLIADHQTAYVEHYRRQSNTTKHFDKSQISKPSSSPTEHHKSPSLSIPVGHCWEKESYKIVDSCRVCFRVETSLPACLYSGYREHVFCDNSGDSFRSCDAPIRSFWYFQIFVFGLAWFFNAQVRSKQEELNKNIREKLQKIDCSV